MKWAIKEYLANINSNDWKNSKNIGFFINMKNNKEISNRNLYDSELIQKLQAEITKRALIMSTFGKRKIWKPSRYIPSRQVVLANSIEELNTLYQIQGLNK